MIETDYCSLFFSIPPGDEPQGTVLLLHGLTACPDEMRELAEQIHHKGYEVKVPCLAGHGTTVSDLGSIRASRWSADVFSAFDACCNQTPVIVGGVSFGALFSLMLATRFPVLVSGVFLLAPPISFRSRRVDLFCKLCSVLPEVLLDRLGSLAKPRRGSEVFSRKRHAYDCHSLAALVRMYRMRTNLLRSLSKVQGHVLILQDPADHHVAPESVEILESSLCNANAKIEWVPGGEHELTIGPQAERVAALVVSFLTEVVGNRACEEELCLEK